MGLHCLNVDMDKSKMYGWVRSVLAIAYTGLFYRLGQHERKWRQVSIS